MKLPGRKKKDEPSVADQLAEPSTPTVGKGRPTPRRRDTGVRRVGPPPPPPRTRKEAYARTKERTKSGRTETRAQSREKMMSGDEGYLMARDRGPVRRQIRDIVDGRRTISTLLLVVAFVVVLASGTGSPRVVVLAQLIWVALLLILILDWLWLGRRISREVRAEHGDKAGSMRGHVWYGITRSLQFRRMRVPRPAPRGSSD